MKNLILFLMFPLAALGQWQVGQRNFTPASGGGGGISYVSGSYIISTNGTATTASVSATYGSGNFVAIWVFNGYHNTTAFSVSDGTNTYVSDGDFYASSFAASQSFHVASATAGTYTVTVTVTGSSGSVNTWIVVAQYSGLASKALDAAGTVSTGTTNPETASVTAAAAGELLWCAPFNGGYPETYSSVTSGFNLRSATTDDLAIYDNLSSLSGSNTLSVTASSIPLGEWSAQCVAYH